MIHTITIVIQGHAGFDEMQMRVLFISQKLCQLCPDALRELQQFVVENIIQNDSGVMSLDVKILDDVLDRNIFRVCTCNAIWTSHPYIESDIKTSCSTDLLNCGTPRSKVMDFIFRSLSKINIHVIVLIDIEPISNYHNVCAFYHHHHHHHQQPNAEQRPPV
ncbi:hypothetical protein GQR58_016951 [Nymphon striatum]|nr:hypothetical protein GQR58_016951 [Nymphon striatum]